MLNSRSGAPVRRQKAIERVASGQWQNPARIRPPTSIEQAERARKGRLREVAEGRWRNPGLNPQAQEINSRPHKHSGALASAIEKLKAGARVADLSQDEQEAHRAYRRSLEREHRARMTEGERERRRAQYRKSWYKRKKAQTM